MNPQSRSDLPLVEVEGEAVVYDGRTQDLHYLNPSSALVFSLCDGATPMSEMATAIADVYDLSKEQVDEQVRAVVDELRSAGLLTGEGEPPERERGGPDQRERVRMDVPRSA